MPHRREIGAKHSAADLFERRRQRPRCGCGDDVFERGEDALAVGLAERDKPHAGGNPVCHERMQKGIQRGLASKAVAGASNADGDR